jgi:hypothetical protein
MQGSSDSLDFPESIFREKLVQGFVYGKECARGIDVSPAFEWIFTLQFQQSSDLAQNLRHQLFVHGPQSKTFAA